MNGFEMILPFLKPIEHLILEPYVAGTKANPSTIGPSQSVPWPAATIPK
jgi:hypothetical protein